CGVSPCESRELPGIKSTRKPHAKAWGFFVYLLFVGEHSPEQDKFVGNEFERCAATARRVAGRKARHKLPGIK
ncbi:hypothetical protein, partial [Klebsiella oxytoca]|uniref:hypothetical protein n=1 Tax=Klebsiella oxytoca TaxID=571 RepID=UPI001C2D997F